MKSVPLCYRCEHRARYCETGHGPRCECGDRDKAVRSCYMYRPVAPVVVAPNPGEERPILGPAAFCGRAYGVRVFDGALAAKDAGDGILPYVLPEEAERKAGGAE